MANILASAIVNAAEETLQDSSNDRWSAAELLAWMNMGCRAIVREKPDAYPVRETVLLSSGIWQSLPTSAILLLDAICNKSITSSTADVLLKIPYTNLGSDSIYNGDMELDLGWSSVGTPTTNERSSAYTHGGTYARRYVTDADNEGIKSATHITATGGLYYYEGWIRTSGTSITVVIRKGDDSGNGVSTAQAVTANTWTLIQGFYAESAGGSKCYISFQNASGKTTYVDDVRFIAVTSPLIWTTTPTAYDTLSSPISVVSRKWIDASVPTWTTDTAETTVKHVIYDVNNPKVYGVYPRNSGSGYIEIVTAKLPADVAIDASILLGDEYAEPLVDYVCFRAFSRDADYSRNAERAMAHYQNFMMILGKLDANEALLNPKRKHGAEQ